LVDSVKILGVYIHCFFKQAEDVNFITGIANRRLYLLNVLRKSGLNEKCLDCVFSAIIISRITHAIEYWGNFVSKDLEGKIDKM
jgi:hypothetical protein